MMTKNVLLTGGTGFIGRHLTDVLLNNGFSVSVLTRSAHPDNTAVHYYKWDLKNNQIDEEAVLKADYIVHLAGEGIVEKRWTKKRKKVILESRVKPIELIHAILEKNQKTLNAFVSASAVGIYGAVTNHKICNEIILHPAKDFLGITCQKWENAADRISSLGIRTVKIRTGIVFGPDGGFLAKMVPAFKSGFGTVLGTGRQYLPWIHIDDLCQIYLKAIQSEAMSGPYNACVTDVTTNSRFAKTLADIYGYKIWIPRIPSFILKIALGSMSKAVLKGRRISSEKIQKTGFEFEFTDLERALVNCLK